MRPQAWWTPIGLLAVIGPSRNEYRSGDVVVAVQVLLDDSVSFPPGEQLALQCGKVGTVVNCANAVLDYGHELFSLEQLRRAAALDDQQNARPRIRGRANPRYHLSCPPLPGTSSQPDRRLLDPAGLPRYRADPGAPRRTLAVQAPAQGRYPRGSGRPGFHRPGLAVRGLARAWSPSLPPTRIVPTILLEDQSVETGRRERAYHCVGVQSAAMSRRRPRASRGRRESNATNYDRSICAHIGAVGIAPARACHRRRHDHWSGPGCSPQAERLC